MAISSAIAIVRHGETDWNLARKIQGRTNIPLNDTGRAQAAATAELLGSEAVLEQLGGWAGVVSSPLVRAVETAEIVAAGLQLARPGVEEELWERDFGPAEGMLVEEAHRAWPGLEIPGAESLDSLAARTAAVFSRVLNDAPGTVLVAHGAMIRAGLARLAGTDMPRILNGEVWILRESGARVLRLSLDGELVEHVVEGQFA